MLSFHVFWPLWVFCSFQFLLNRSLSTNFSAPGLSKALAEELLPSFLRWEVPVDVDDPDFLLPFSMLGPRRGGRGRGGFHRPMVEAKNSAVARAPPREYTMLCSASPRRGASQLLQWRCLLQRKTIFNPFWPAVMDQGYRYPQWSSARHRLPVAFTAFSNFLTAGRDGPGLSLTRWLSSYTSAVLASLDGLLWTGWS